MMATHRFGALGGPNRIPTVLTAGFRFFFLSAGIFSVFAMFAWTVWLGVHAAGGTFVSTPLSMAPHLWHAHEMVFGYTAAVIAGFFVTAVPNWTGTKEAGSLFVIASGAVWLAGRVAIWFSNGIDPVIVAAVDLAFVPVLSTAVLGRLARKSQARNMVFLALLTALLTGNLMMHMEWVGWTDDTAQAGVRMGIFTSTAMIAIIGGRVVPAFTRNALLRAGYQGPLPVSRVWLDRAGILLVLLTALAFLPFVPEVLRGGLCLAAGLVTLLRLAGWQGWAARKEPILWILHAAYLLLGFGYLVYGVTLLTGEYSETAALHLLAAGAIGSMTLAMMTRASLGHAGLPLKVSKPIVLAYVLLIAAALVRSFGLGALGYFETMLLSGGLWIVAFGLYVGVYFPILTTPRTRK
ncbi:NnrS protein (plasmid) [Labrenzia sp. THAF191b]|uniref:NnrS family protein n=1 Tax=unclassified Labrenzia TaxID=2648686 RepID=UPI0012680326|nr:MULTISPECIES: NnrS family protein [unclassified Labrenzia]QFT01489.1 NnrS protein [Labrenzia sp. THAF191b]QFT08196.1 NnrS protein [Labrenzia sp. THAF191a]QFT19440.1 NnrS protein [Labrenzia sp. THAF187b]